MWQDHASQGAVLSMKTDDKSLGCVGGENVGIDTRNERSKEEVGEGPESHIPGFTRPTATAWRKGLVDTGLAAWLSERPAVAVLGGTLSI